MRVSLSLIMLLFGAKMAMAETCLEQGTQTQVVDEVRTQTYCEHGVVSSKKIYFKNSDQVATEFIFAAGKLVERKNYSTKGELGTWQKLQYIAENHWIREILSLESDNFGTVKNRVELINYNPFEPLELKSQVVREWFYTSKPVFHAKYSQQYLNGDTTKPVSKEIYSETGEIISKITFSYQEGAAKPHAFTERVQDNIVRQYELYEPFTPERTWEQANLSEEERGLRARNLADSQRFLIAIIDSGFDYNHLELAHQWWNNPLEPQDGLDNDGNGWVDDRFGWDQVSNSALPTESSTNLASDWRPLSHGTHVAHIATRDLWGVGLIGFAGDYTQASYIHKVSAFIKKHGIKIVNMSLGLPADMRDLMGLRDAARAYQKMVIDNPKTLFVFAAGNSESDIDIYRNRQYPASINGDNVITVGAFDPALQEMAYFSNFGKKSVDILAPGVQIEAASLGGGLIKHSGTSMASPFMVNLAAKLWMEFPLLQASEVRQIFLNTAQVLTPPAPVVSEGVANLAAARLVARSTLSRTQKVNRRWSLIEGKQSRFNGPNCWNSALYLNGLASTLHHSDAYEFRHVIESALCQKVSTPALGDIVALRRANASGKILREAMHSEIHGYVYENEIDGLTKNGTSADVAYTRESHQKIFSFYDRSQKLDCRIQGIPREHCQMLVEYYRCEELKSDVSIDGFLLKLDQLAAEISQLYFNSNQDRAVVEQVIKQKVDLLELEWQQLQRGEDSFSSEFISNRLASLRVTSF